MNQALSHLLMHSLTDPYVHYHCLAEQGQTKNQWVAANLLLESCHTANAYEDRHVDYPMT